MILTLHCARDEDDQLLPFLAFCNHANIQSRGATEQDALANVRGICLAWLGNWDNPPRSVQFRVKK